MLQSASGVRRVWLRRTKREVVGVKKFERFFLSSLEFLRRRPGDISEDSSHGRRVRMFLPGGISQHLEHHFPQRLVTRFGDPIQQTFQTKPGPRLTHTRQVILAVTIGITYLES